MCRVWGSDGLVHLVSATPDSLAGVVLAAGAGTRLAPLTRLRPKALCPVAGQPMVDLAIERIAGLVDEVWVNVHHNRSQLEAHLAEFRTSSGQGVRVSVEEHQALGTAGALGNLRSELEGRGVLVVNADAWYEGDAGTILAGWDGERVRVLVPGGGPFGPKSAVAATLLPWADAAGLPASPSGLYEYCWAPAAGTGRLEVVAHSGSFVDCGTPQDYLRANLAASRGVTVLGAGARVLGRAERCVLWEGVTVRAGEVLTDAVRASDRCTVLVR